MEKKKIHRRLNQFPVAAGGGGIDDQLSLSVMDRDPVTALYFPYPIWGSSPGSVAGPLPPTLNHCKKGHPIKGVFSFLFFFLNLLGCVFVFRGVASKLIIVTLDPFFSRVPITRHHKGNAIHSSQDTDHGHYLSQRGDP